MDLEIQQLFINAALRYKGMLSKFRPCKPGSEFVEQNLITILCHEFLLLHDDGISYTELPFANPNTKKWDLHLDAYLANEQVCYLVEAKGSLTAKDLFSSIQSDVVRIFSDNLQMSLQTMAQGDSDDDRNYVFPCQSKGLIVANTWSKQTAQHWLSDPDNLFSSLSRKIYSLGEYGVNKKYELFMLAGQTKDNLMLHSLA